MRLRIFSVTQANGQPATPQQLIDFKAMPDNIDKNPGTNDVNIVTPLVVRVGEVDDLTKDDVVLIRGN